MSNWFTNEPALRLAKRLVDATFAERAFFCNSGAEANEAALKLARRYAHDRHGPDKIRVISTLNAFHGRTLFTVTAGGQAKYATGFGPNPAGFTHIPYNDVAALEAEFRDEGGDDICAVILEPMQGEGGMMPGTPEFLQAARRLCDAHSALLILDEIQSGMGRTGTLFSYMQKGIVPDILTSAKGLGGGFPIGAMLTTADIASAFSVGVHGTTYGGNPLACAVAGAVFDVINTTEVLDGVKARHALFMEGLKAINARRHVFAELRGEGVWIGCRARRRLEGQGDGRREGCRRSGRHRAGRGPDVVRIAPSLVISLDEILEGLARLEVALNRALRPSSGDVLRPADRAGRPAGGARAVGAHRTSASRRCPPTASASRRGSSARSRRSRGRRRAPKPATCSSSSIPRTRASSASPRSRRRSA